MASTVYETEISSGELGPAECKNHAQLQRKTKFCLGLFLARREREINVSYRQQFCPCEKPMKELSILSLANGKVLCQPGRKNHQGGLEYSEDDPTLSYFLFLTLKLAFVRICPDFYTFLCKFFTFLNACISVKTSPINAKLGDFVSLGVLFLTMWINSC